MKIKDKITRVGKEYHDKLEEIIYGRKLGIDKKYPKPLSFARITNVMIKLPSWFQIEKELLAVPRGDEK